MGAIQTFDLYLDESGNTGNKLFDSSQPVFVYAGWLVRHSALSEFEEVIRRTLRSLPGTRVELKGSAVLKSRRTRPMIESMLDRFAEQPTNVQPVFTIWEKRYAAAIDVTQTLLNPTVVQELSDDFVRDREFNQHIANEFYNLPSNTLARCWYAVDRRDVPAVTASLKEVLRQFDIAGNEQMAEHLRVVANFVPDLLSHQIETMDSDPVWKGLRGLHAQSLVGLLNDVERIGRSGSGTIQVYADEILQYRDVMKHAFEYMRNRPYEEIAFPDGTVLRRGFRSFTGLDFLRSRANLGIQAADILASLLARLTSSSEPFADSLRDKTRSIASLANQADLAAKFVVSRNFHY